MCNVDGGYQIGFDCTKFWLMQSSHTPRPITTFCKWTLLTTRAATLATPWRPTPQETTQLPSREAWAISFAEHPHIALQAKRFPSMHPELLVLPVPPSVAPSPISRLLVSSLSPPSLPLFSGKQIQRNYEGFLQKIRQLNSKSYSTDYRIVC